jgi:hypothetical protein
LGGRNDWCITLFPSPHVPGVTQFMLGLKLGYLSWILAFASRVGSPRCSLLFPKSSPGIRIYFKLRLLIALQLSPIPIQNEVDFVDSSRNCKFLDSFCCKQHQTGRQIQSEFSRRTTVTGKNPRASLNTECDHAKSVCSIPQSPRYTPNGRTLWSECWRSTMPQ